MIEESLRRRYLLGEASDEECVAIEQAFMRDLVEQERMAAAEEELIEDQIEGKLDEQQRQQFESHYLASPQHRERLYTTRRLLAAAGASSPVRETPQAPSGRRGTGMPSRAWIGLAAALLLVVTGATWMLSGRVDTRRIGDETSAPPPPAVFSPSTSAPTSPPAPAATPATPRAFAIVLSASTVRSGDDQPAIVMPEDTELVTLRLEGERRQGRLTGLTVVVKTLGGDEIWRGAATPNPEPGVLARVDLPAARLPADDYIIALLETRATSPHRELDRYFLRIRTP